MGPAAALAVVAFQLATTARPAAAAPVTADVAASAVALAEARARWARALDAARWDRARPAVVAVADELTAQLVPTLVPPGPLHVTTLELLADLGGDALGDHLRGPHPIEPRVAAGYLDRHQDAGLVASVLAAGVPATTFAVELARTRSTAAAPLIVQALRGSTAGFEREELCRAALRLGPRASAEVAAVVAEGWRERPPDDTAPHCVVLGAGVAAGRAALARLLARPLTGAAPWWHLVAGLALYPTAHRPVAERAVRAAVQGASPEGDLFAWEGRARSLGALAPWLPLDHPAVRRDLRRVADLAGPFEWTLAPALLRARDGALLAHGLDTLRVPHERPEYLALGLLYVGLLTPARDAPALARSVTTLQSLRRQLLDRGDHDLPAAAPGAVAQWVEALQQTAACRDDACLAALIASGSDEAAARAAFVLGPAGVAALPGDALDALARRVVMRTAPALTVAALLGTRGCPAALRGLRELARGEAVQVRGLVLDPFAAAYERACRE